MKRASEYIYAYYVFVFEAFDNKISSRTCTHTHAHTWTRSITSFVMVDCGSRRRILILLCFFLPLLNCLSWEISFTVNCNRLDFWLSFIALFRIIFDLNGKIRYSLKLPENFRWTTRIIRTVCSFSPLMIDCVWHFILSVAPQ